MSRRNILMMLFFSMSLISVSILLTIPPPHYPDPFHDPTWEEGHFTTIEFNKTDCIICRYGFTIFVNVRDENVKPGFPHAVCWCEFIGWVRCHLESERESKDGYILYTAIIKKYIDIKLEDGRFSCPFTGSKSLDSIKNNVTSCTGIEPLMVYVELIDYPEDIIVLIKQVDYERL